MGTKVFVLEVSLSPLTLLSCSGRRSDKTRRVRGLAMVDPGGCPVQPRGVEESGCEKSLTENPFSQRSRRLNSCARERERRGEERVATQAQSTPREKEQRGRTRKVCTVKQS